MSKKYRTTRVLSLLTALSATSLGLTACGTGGAAAKNTTLNIYTGSTGQFSANFSPFSPTRLQATDGVIYETLFFYNPVKVEEPKPMLGTDFTWNDKGTELKITIREGVKWTDGKPFSAKDVAFTFNYTREHADINTQGFKGKAVADDATHVTLTFDTPSFMDAPKWLGATFIVPEHIWAENDAPGKDVNANPVGTGPFKTSTFAPQNFSLDKNEDYWQEGKPALSELRYISLSGNTTSIDKFLAGEIDWMSTSIPEIDKVIGGDKDLAYTSVQQSQMSLYTCSNADLGCEGAQTDPAVRRAVAQGIDRDQINKLAFSGTAEPISATYALLPRDEVFVSVEVPEKTLPMEAQKDKAVKTLEDAGYAKGDDGVYAKDGKRVSMTVKLVTGWNDYVSAVDVMAEQLKEVGIELKPQQVSQNEWTQAKSDGKFELLIDGIFPGPAPDPYYIYDGNFNSRNTKPVGEIANPNYARYSNKAVDAAIAELSTIPTVDAAARAVQYDIIQRRIVQDMPYIPVLTGSTLTEYRTDKFEGWPTEENPYAFGAAWKSIDIGQVVTNIKPKS